MVTNRATVSLILGLLALVQADVPKSNDVLDALGSDFLYKEFACRNKTNGLRLPISGSCVDYYECRNGLAERLSCKEGFHFNNYGLTCLDARMSKCKPDQTSSPISCTGQCCGRNNGIYSVVGSCSNFLVCISGQPFERSCGKHLQFSSENLICDVAERARCSSVIGKDIIGGSSSDLEQPTIGEPMYMVSRRVCLNKPNGYNVAIAGSCNKFYLCINGVGYLKSCGNMHFNPEKQFCDSKKRMFCSEFEEGEVILDEEEYVPISTLPMPIPLPHPNPQPIPLDVEEEDYVVRPNKKGKKDKKNKLNSNKRPAPYEPEQDQAEEIVHIWTPWGKRPVQAEPEPDAVQSTFVQKPQNNRRPRPSIDEEQLESDDLDQAPPRPNKRPHKGKRRPAPPQLEIPDSSEIVREPSRPNSRPAQQNNKQSQPEPPYLYPREDEGEQVSEEVDDLPSMNFNVCSDEPVGALLPIPNECSKYIRCRWDYFERRAAEVLTCPLDMHFNAKTKYCDLPSKAGCKARLENEKESTRNKWSSRL